MLPVNYKVHDGAIVFRTAQNSQTGEDLQTGIAHAEYQVAFEIDQINPETRDGWSVLIHGPAHHMTSDSELAAVRHRGSRHGRAEPVSTRSVSPPPRSPAAA